MNSPRQLRPAAMRGHKKLFRLLRAETLVAVRRRSRKRASGTRRPFPVPYRANQRWSLDIVSGAFEDGQQIIETSRIDCNTQRPHTPLGGSPNDRFQDRRNRANAKMPAASAAFWDTCRVTAMSRKRRVSGPCSEVRKFRVFADMSAKSLSLANNRFSASGYPGPRL